MHIVCKNNTFLSNEQVYCTKNLVKFMNIFIKIITFATKYEESNWINAAIISASDVVVR